MKRGRLAMQLTVNESYVGSNPTASAPCEGSLSGDNSPDNNQGIIMTSRIKILFANNPSSTLNLDDFSDFCDLVDLDLELIMLRALAVISRFFLIRFKCIIFIFIN